MRLMFLTLFRPGEAAALIAARPRWLAAFLGLSLLSVIISAVTYPQFLGEMLVRLPSTATHEDRELLVRSLESELPARLAFLPIRLFLGWGTFTLVLLYLAKLFEPKEVIRYRQILSLEVHSEAIGVLAGCVTMISFLAGSGRIQLSLAGITGGNHALVLESILRHASVFTLWQMAVQGVALSRMCGFGNVRAVGVVLLTWAIAISFNAGVVQILVDRFHLF
jgi:hypothetical protein